MLCSQWKPRELWLTKVLAVFILWLWVLCQVEVTILVHAVSFSSLLKRYRQALYSSLDVWDDFAYWPVKKTGLELPIKMYISIMQAHILLNLFHTSLMLQHHLLLLKEPQGQALWTSQPGVIFRTLRFLHYLWTEPKS